MMRLSAYTVSVCRFVGFRAMFSTPPTNGHRGRVRIISDCCYTLLWSRRRRQRQVSANWMRYHMPPICYWECKDFGWATIDINSSLFMSYSTERRKVQASTRQSIVLEPRPDSPLCVTRFQPIPHDHRFANPTLQGCEPSKKRQGGSTGLDNAASNDSVGFEPMLYNVYTLGVFQKILDDPLTRKTAFKHLVHYIL